MAAHEEQENSGVCRRNCTFRQIHMIWETSQQFCFLNFKTGSCGVAQAGLKSHPPALGFWVLRRPGPYRECDLVIWECRILTGSVTLCPVIVSIVRASFICFSYPVSVFSQLTLLRVCQFYLFQTIDCSFRQSPGIHFSLYFISLFLFF